MTPGLENVILRPSDEHKKAEIWLKRIWDKENLE